MCNVYMEPGPSSKTGFKVLNLKKNCDRTGTKEFKPLPKEASHKFLNVKIRPQLLSKRKNGTTIKGGQAWALNSQPLLG